ncbi:DUF2878 domain-containing protein [Pseudomonas sp. LRF_L74]|uniref:DUF2878 domain-containing protein n=1 Tax=Pseudomonas sp. LRF_L74 TaxID=3369422 RepID=UPI003F638004
MKRQLANAALFQTGWLACVFGAQRPWLLLVAVICLTIHLVFLADGRREALLILGITLCGTALDSLLLNLGVFDFHNASPVIPPWLVLLWALFATTLRHCLHWTARPWWLGCLLGALFAPLSYYGGAHLAGVEFPLGVVPTLPLLGLVWVAVMGTANRLARRVDSKPTVQ